MYKVVWIARFRPDLDRADARRHWREVHGPLGRAVPGIERYVQSHVVSALDALGPSDAATGFDGYSCCWYADRESFRASLRTPEWQAVAEDWPNVFDTESLHGMSAAVDEQAIIDGAEGPFKAAWIVRFTDEIRADPDRIPDAHAYWTEMHGGHFGRKVPGIDRYVQNHVVEAIGPDGPTETPLAFDGFSECWYADRRAFDRSMNSREWLAMNADAENVFDLSFVVPGMSAILDENVVKREGGLVHA